MRVNTFLLVGMVLLVLEAGWLVERFLISSAGVYLGGAVYSGFVPVSLGCDLWFQLVWWIHARDEHCGGGRFRHLCPMGAFVR